MEISHSSNRTKQLVIVGFLSRLFTDTTAQMFYAFLPLLAAGVGVTPIVFGRLLSIRSSAGFMTPLFGNLAERRGYRNTLPIILLCGAVGAITFASVGTLWLLIPAIFVLGLGVTTFQPLLIAYSSEAIPANHRARGMSIIEYAWALSSIVGVYAVGQMLNLGNWQLPLFVLGGGLGVMAIILALTLRNQPDLDDTPPIPLREQFRITENRTEAYAGIGVQVLITFAGLHIFISYSIWLVDTFQFDAIRLATVVLGFGFVDLVGSGLVSVLLDRLGRRKALMLGGMLATAVFFIMEPASSLGLGVALAFLFGGRFLFEFTIVSGLIAVSEQSPSQRSRVMSLMAFLTTISTALAGLTGPVAYAQWNLAGLTIPTGTAFLFTAVLAHRYIK